MMNSVRRLHENSTQGGRPRTMEGRNGINTVQNGRKDDRDPGKDRREA
jgi:hypothetical protein